MEDQVAIFDVLVDDDDDDDDGDELREYGNTVPTIAKILDFLIFFPTVLVGTTICRDHKTVTGNTILVSTKDGILEGFWA